MQPVGFAIRYHERFGVMVSYSHGKKLECEVAKATCVMFQSKQDGVCDIVHICSQFSIHQYI